MNDERHRLLALTDHLAAAGPAQKAWTWQSWQIERIEQGMNNRLFRVQGEGGEYAVKFTIRDRRDRAGREWWAMHGLQAAGLAVAPQPVLLVRHRHAQPVVVQSWLAGDVDGQLPAADGDWQQIIDHLRLVHSVCPGALCQRLHGHRWGRTILASVHTLTWSRLWPDLRPVVLHLTNSADAMAQIRWQLAQIPAVAQPRLVQELAARAARITFPTWPPVRLTLCRADPNIRNFIRRPGGWASVDWEYSGWGDPAFEIADLLTHAAHLDIGDERRQWCIDRYCAQSPDPGCAERIAVYCTLMLVWWCVRLARYTYETARGLDPRLAQPAGDWAATKQRQLEIYLERADAALTSWGG